MEKISGKTKHGELSLDDMAGLMPGMSEVMLVLSHRYHVMYYACKLGNWQLAGYQLRAIRKLFGTAELTRPKYREALRKFAEQYLDKLDEAVRSSDWPAFSEIAESSIRASDRFHDEWGYPYIRYRIPDTPPPGYYIGSPDSFSPEKETGIEERKQDMSGPRGS